MVVRNYPTTVNIYDSISKQINQATHRSYYSNENIRIEKKKPDDWSFNFDENKNKLTTDFPVTDKNLSKTEKRIHLEIAIRLTWYGFV